MSFTVRSTHENDEDAEHFKHEPAVAGYARVVLQQLPLRAGDVRLDVERVRVDALHRLALLGDHVCELREYLAELSDGGLDGFYGSRSGLDVVVLNIRKIKS